MSPLISWLLVATVATLIAAACHAHHRAHRKHPQPWAQVSHCQVVEPIFDVERCGDFS